ncbi:Cell wall alpha-1,3-glucan synthase ags1 [Saitoella coloradoensis]
MATRPNLFYPYEEYTLNPSTTKLGLNGSSEYNGCLAQVELPAWGYKAFVPKNQFADPSPVITKFLPGHDHRVQSNVSTNESESVAIDLHFSMAMNCSSVTNAITIVSNIENGTTAELDRSSVQCSNVSVTEEPPYLPGIPTVWTWKANLTSVYNGVHEITVTNATSLNQTARTNTVDRFLLRIGQSDNPMVFPRDADYSSSLLYRDSNDDLYVSHKAAGATMFRYSLNWKSSYSEWTNYTGGVTKLQKQAWTGTTAQAWEGFHVYVQYWGKLAASSNHRQHGDVIGYNKPERRFPHVFVLGTYNQYGYDLGLPNGMKQDFTGTWSYKFMTEWPTSIHLNVWGVNPDGQADQTTILGDVDKDGVLDRIPPNSLIKNVINITGSPPSLHTGWTIFLDDKAYRYYLVPVGSRRLQLALYVLLAVVPLASGGLAAWMFMRSFYRVKFNKSGIAIPGVTPVGLLQSFMRLYTDKGLSTLPIVPETDLAAPRITVLLATMEYDIDDWEVKVKIGGLGVLAQLMATRLNHQDIIWVVPCYGDIEYPLDQPAEAMNIEIMGKSYIVNVQYHVVRNITYVILDAPVFRKQLKADPYPTRMDDLESAVFYSSWNQCIAEASRRFHVDLYHINDYHGALAPLYLLPEVIPCCLSLRNSEFQGLWGMRTHQERDEICHIFNLSKDVARKYVQFGEVFNLLHAGATYLRIHQKGAGAVGVSQKYGKRSLARYPIFWSLPKIGSLPNPDPEDIADIDMPNEVTDAVLHGFESARPELRLQAQKWAGLEEKADADLFVFVGRWSMQKGIDLIADVFPSILDSNPNVQLICVGPVIDLYGRFAALKLEKLMQRYPFRVFSKPEFTALPPYIFSGAEFALIPSRDEPFGLVAVEFGRKGALGVGSRVGGLGQMPGWWFSIESTTPKHLLRQFKTAIRNALSSSRETRADMRAKAVVQRFPVAQWVRDLTILQASSIEISKSRRAKTRPNSNSISVKNFSEILRISAPATPYSTPMSPSPSNSVYYSPASSVRSVSPELTPPSPTHASDSFVCPSPSTTLSSVGRTGVAHGGLVSPSALSVESVVGERSDFALMKVDPVFTDANGEYYSQFEEKLASGSADRANDMSIQEYLMKSEKKFFNRYNEAKLGNVSVTAMPISPSPAFDGSNSTYFTSAQETFWLGQDYRPPTGFKKFFQRKMGDWPVYSLFLALGQIVAANSYQISLLSGEIGQTTSIYLASSLLWWFAFRRFQSVYVLSAPFAVYGAAFLVLGISPFMESSSGIGWGHNVASGLYSVASASGSIYFAVNFGDEGGASVRSWIFRAAVVQGAQQLYIAALWFWGSMVSKRQVNNANIIASGAVVASVSLPLAILFCVLAMVVYLGLPTYYHQTPGNIPSFYTALLRRKIVVWFFVAVIIQNYWLSAPYGRNWQFLWSSQHAKIWMVIPLLLFFFIVVWGIHMWIFRRLSKSHSWILPIFAIGLGAPRWCQMLWGTSNVGQYLAWAGSPVTGALVSRALWLWLGVLDSVQGVGLGMLLLQTMTRQHITFTLVGAQVIGSVATIVARAISPNKIGPGPVFPDFSLGTSGLQNTLFWVPLLMQLVICVGFFAFFRKEQLMKPGVDDWFGEEGGEGDLRCSHSYRWTVIRWTH